MLYGFAKPPSSATVNSCPLAQEEDSRGCQATVVPPPWPLLVILAAICTANVWASSKRCYCVVPWCQGCRGAVGKLTKLRLCNATLSLHEEPKRVRTHSVDLGQPRDLLGTLGPSQRSQGVHGGLVASVGGGWVPHMAHQRHALQPAGTPMGNKLSTAP